MNLTTALRLEDGELAAFLGDNDQSRVMFRLADEIVEAGGRVITTTTAPLALDEVRSAPVHFSAFEIDRARLEAALDKKSHVLLTGPVDLESGQAAGVTMGLINSLRVVPDLTAILIWAGGAHEPEIPEEATLIIPILGSEVFDQRELKHAPLSARVIPFIHQVETAEQLAAARATAKDLLQNPAVASVALGVGRGAHPVREVHGRVTALILAAGRSTRMGRPKQTLPWSEGKTIVSHIVHQLRAGEIDDVVVVTGSHQEEVAATLRAEVASVRLVFNPDFENSEMARSLQLGLQAAPTGCLAALVALGDQPQIEPAVVRTVLQRWRETQAPVVAPVYQQRRGHPMLFDRATWPGVLSLPPASNPRKFIESAGQAESPFGIEYVEVATDSILRDIDTPEDYERERRVV
jgi:molybdenum cofactor cytidylyltransferase